MPFGEPQITVQRKHLTGVHSTAKIYRRIYLDWFYSYFLFMMAHELRQFKYAEYIGSSLTSHLLTNPVMTMSNINLFVTILSCKTILTLSG